MEAEPLDRRARRRVQKKEALLAAAWELARERGLAGVSQREVADRLDLAQPSLYSYFASKHDLYDAMFADGNRILVERMEALPLPDDPREALKATCRALMDFFMEDPVRYQLLFERTIPGFVPSEEAYGWARRFYDWHRGKLEAAGVRGQEYMDVFVALQAGLAGAQLHNDPGGDRWTRHLDWVLDMFLEEVARRQKRRPASPRRADS
jgi:AcrR family transcriptional regulator